MQPFYITTKKLPQEQSIKMRSENYFGAALMAKRRQKLVHNRESTECMTDNKEKHKRSTEDVMESLRHVHCVRK